jgi:uncharacterized protein (TIGR02453 family)
LQNDGNTVYGGVSCPLLLYCEIGFPVPEVTLLSLRTRQWPGRAGTFAKLTPTLISLDPAIIMADAHPMRSAPRPPTSPSPFAHVAGQPYFREAGLKFLRSLRRNNRREWFQPRKPEFDRELKQPMLALVEAVNGAMQDFAPAHLRLPQKCMMRIYRDIRFSSDKRPYKSHVSAWWSREGLEKTSGGGYYLHVSPDEVLIAAGVYMPEREQLRAIREYLLAHHAEVRRLLTDRKLRSTMDSLSTMPLTRPPKGFPKEHPAMDLLLCRQWGVEAKLAPAVALRTDFADEVIRRFRLATPLVNALNTPLVARLKIKRRPLFGL